MARPTPDEDAPNCRKCGHVMLRIGSRWTDLNGESICPQGGLHKV